MSQSKITLIGIENYLNPDHSVFENMVLPEGIDKDTLIGTIFLRCQEFELLYSDPYFLTAAVNVWSRKHYWTFDKWVKLLNKQYDPLYNKDYYEEWTDTHSGNFAKNGQGSSSGGNTENTDLTRTDNLTEATDMTRTDNLSQSVDSTRTDNLTTTNDLTKTNNLTRTDNLHTTNDVTLTHSEKAYNSGATFVETTKDVTDQDGSQTGTVTDTGTVKDTGTVTNTGTVRNAGTATQTGTQRNAGTVSNTGTQRELGTNNGTFNSSNSLNESGTDTYEDTRYSHQYGNIGVTSAQALFMRETEVARFNMYEHIADLFATEFCIMVY